MMIPLAGGWLGDTDYDSWKLMSPDEEAERYFGPQEEDEDEAESLEALVAELRGLHECSDPLVVVDVARRAAKAIEGIEERLQNAFADGYLTCRDETGRAN